MTRTLEGLRTLSTTVYEHSGLDNLLEAWMTSVFGQWKGFIMSIMVSLSVFTAILATCGCCCVPCIRALFVRLINRGVGESDTKSNTRRPLLGNGESQYENIMVKDLV